MDFKLSTTDIGEVKMTYDVVLNTTNNILLSLNTRAGSFFLLPEFGSKLHEVKTTTSQDIQLAKQYTLSALKWMVDTNRIENVSVTANKTKDGISIIVNYAEKALKYNVTYFLRVY